MVRDEATWTRWVVGLWGSIASRGTGMLLEDLEEGRKGGDYIEAEAQDDMKTE